MRVGPPDGINDLEKEAPVLNLSLFLHTYTEKEEVRRSHGEIVAA